MLLLYKRHFSHRSQRRLGLSWDAVSWGKMCANIQRTAGATLFIMRTIPRMTFNALNKLLCRVLSSVNLCSVKKNNTFYSNVVIWPQWEQILKAGVRHPLYLKGLLFHTTAVLSITPTCGLLSHFSNCPLGLRCQFLQNLFLALCLAALYYKGSCLPMTCLLKCSWHESMTVRQRGGRRELINQMIHGMWNIRHQ